MSPENRARAAKEFLANPLMNALFDAIERDRLDGIAASALPDREIREMNYHVIRALSEMRGQLDVWAHEA